MTDIKNKTLSEKEMRQKLINIATKYGFDYDLRQIFSRYDPLLRCATDPSELKAIAVMANVEVHRLFGFNDALMVEGKEIIPAAQGYDLQTDIDNLTKV